MLLLAITAHGFGHASQSAPVVNRLRELCPDLGLVIVADLSPDWLQGRFSGQFHHVPLATDPGLPMRDPMHVDWVGATALYSAFMAQTEDMERRIKAIIDTHRVDLVLADVPWVPLQAAAQTGLPAVAMSSLNWADILRGSPEGSAANAAVIAAMEDAYQDADAFIRTEPAMPMDWLRNAVTVGPVAKLGRAQRAPIREHLGLQDDHMLALSQFGGIDGLSSIRLPMNDRVHWMVSKSTVAGSPVSCAEDIMSALDLNFVDLIASVDVMLTKPGYGSFAEAACHGTRVLCVERPEWPEAPYLEAWLRKHVPMSSITTEQLYAGAFAEKLDRLLQQPCSAPITPQGADEAAHLLAGYLS